MQNKPIRKHITKETRERVHAKYGGYCAYCGCLLEYKDMQVDHLHPVHKGGSNDFDNLMPACRSCNHYKETFTLKQFRDRLSATFDNLKESPTFRLALRYGLASMPGTWNRKFYFETPHHDKHTHLS